MLDFFLILSCFHLLKACRYFAFFHFYRGFFIYQISGFIGLIYAGLKLCKVFFGTPGTKKLIKELLLIVWHPKR